MGFGLCLPYRLVPSFVQYRLLSPPVPLVNGRAALAPYPLCKVEAALLATGFKRDEVVIVPPDHLREFVSNDTEVIGIHVLDPMGLAPVSWTLRVLSGGGDTCTHYEFERLMRVVRELKRRFKFRVVVGGPGIWQLRGLEERYGIDVLFDGEAELTFPKLVRDLLNGREVPKYVVGESVPPNLIPPIVTPSRNGVVQITRGCPRRCRFCSPTMLNFRSVPLETILREVKLNLESGVRAVGLATEDVLLYGARGVEPNVGAIKELYSRVINLVRRYGLKDPVGFSHVTLSTALVAKEAVKYISEVNSLSSDRPLFPQVGLESGSPRLVAKYFSGKPYPWKPSEWWDVVLGGTKLINDNYWYPCYTYIVGFPDATPDDYVMTTELLDRLREEGFKGWAFPLLLIPIGGTAIERSGYREFKTLKELPQEAIDTIVAGWRLSIEFSYEIYPKVLSSIKNPIIRKVINALARKAIDAMKEWLEGIRRDPSIVERIFSRVNVRSPVGLAKTVIATGVAKLAHA